MSPARSANFKDVSNAAHAGPSRSVPLWSSPTEADAGARTNREAFPADRSKVDELLYVFVRQLEWERRGDTAAGWDVVLAARSPHADIRAHAHAMLERVAGMDAPPAEDKTADQRARPWPMPEPKMKTPRGCEMIESCMDCQASRENFFCRFSSPVLRTMDEMAQHSVMPNGAILFVEGQSPRGIYVVCSGKVKLTTTSKDGRVLIFKQADAGDVLGLSAVISGTKYEMNAQTATACQLNFIGRQHVMAMLQKDSEFGVHVALWMSREFQSAYRGMHDLVLARSSSGKLARLLLSSAPPSLKASVESPLRSIMTHEEMAQRIGSSRETVTRLLTDLKKRRLIRLDGPTLIIRDRDGLEALAV